MAFAAAFAGALLAAAVSLPSLPVPPPPPRSPIRLPPLGPGEVLVEVRGSGLVRTPATRAILTLHAVGTGATRAQARRALEAAVQRLSAQLRARGVAPADIAARPAPSVNQDLRTFDVEEPPPTGADLPAPEPYEAGTTVTIIVRDAARLDALQSGLTGPFAAYVRSEPRYELDDDKVARAEARRLAMAAARGDAEAYATALGMRIGRTLRVTEHPGPDIAALMTMEWADIERQSRRAAEPHLVETEAVVGVDYVLVPR